MSAPEILFTAVAPGGNRLASEGSPYLLEHARNPVDWYPWGSEAFAAARDRDCLIFLSIGYSACHWCHVMARESFADPLTAALLNAQFVAIKVDRDERPDIDRAFMTAVQAMTGLGGWPLSVFLTPDLQPLFGGTYFPPEDRHGLPAFRRVLEALAAFWRERRTEALKSAATFAESLRAAAATAGGGALSDGNAIRRRAVESLLASADDESGGFGRAPKFPPATALAFLLRHPPAMADSQVRDVVVRTLEGMADGGIFDHVGGGFHRYAVDRRWLVPHFEKMLADNALLAAVYLDAFLLTGTPRWRDVCVATLDYVLRDMTGAAGAFHASEDADSAGEEGSFYVWDKAEIVALLGETGADVLCQRYGVAAHGTFAGRNILHAAIPVAEAARSAGLSTSEAATRLHAQLERLRLARDSRTRPARDETVIASWNALMVTALVRAGDALGIARFRQAAWRAGHVLDTCLRHNGQLRHVWRGDACPAALPAAPGFLDDYALVANAFLDLYESTFEPTWFAAALELAETMVAEFRDGAGDGFFYSAAAHGTPLLREKPFVDHPMPSGNSAAARLLFRLGLFTGNADWTALGEGILRAAATLLEQMPSESPHLLNAAAFVWDRPFEVAVVGAFQDPRTMALLAAARSALSSPIVLAAWDPDASGADDGGRLVPLLAGRRLANGRPCAYVCHGFACQAPTTDPDAVRRMLDRDRPGG